MAVNHHLLVTNDFPPKVGGIQSYLWELWRRLPPASFTVLTASSHPEAPAFDAAQARLGFRIERVRAPVLAPTPALARRIRALAAETGASLVVLDPALPLGLLGPALGGLPYGVVLHGAEVAVPGRLPGSRQALAAVLGRARLAVCAGRYPAAEAARCAGGRMPAVVEIPPGVDTDRLRPLPAAARRKARATLGLPPEGPLVVSVSRLVPRKGMDVVVEAAAALAPSFPAMTVAIAGSGRQRGRLEAQVRATGAPVRLLGQVPDGELALLYGAADVFVMACRDRWLGLEQEGFGIVFLEAAACGVPQVAGRSGGADEAVEHGRTGLVVDEPGDPGHVAAALRRLLVDDEARRAMGRAARRRARTRFAWDLLAHRLAGAFRDVEG
ncbi:MAG TPA: glycosyltransferase family 4 protein [Acidimicrobiales bacterium]|nr:glycosyltransferase family 4 protein [Acidimicrobiales bacterium]